MAKMTKICPGCNRWIPIENFRGEMCAACTLSPKRPKGLLIVKDKKRCPRCTRELSRSYFSTNTSRSDGLSTYCRDCDREKHRIARQKKLGSGSIGIMPAPASAVPAPEDRPTTKTCVKCGRELPLEAFPVRPEVSSGYDSRCKECFNAACRASKENRKKAEEYQAEKAARGFSLPPVPPKIDARKLPKLDTCPFCGKKPKLRRVIVSTMTSWEIECACTADPSRYITFSFETPAEAGAFWNSRPGVAE